MTEYIERKALEKYFENHRRLAIHKDDIVATIANTPAADVVEVRRAKFKLIQSGKGVCSNCHRLDSIDKLAKYCRYCGALMDGKDGEAK